MESARACREGSRSGNVGTGSRFRRERERNFHETAAKAGLNRGRSRAMQGKGPQRPDRHSMLPREKNRAVAKNNLALFPQNSLNRPHAYEKDRSPLAALGTPFSRLFGIFFALIFGFTGVPYSWHLRAGGYYDEWGDWIEDPYDYDDPGYYDDPYYDDPYYDDPYPLRRRIRGSRVLRKAHRIGKTGTSNGQRTLLPRVLTRDLTTTSVAKCHHRTSTGRRVQRPRLRVGLKPEPLWNSFDCAGKKVVRASARRRTTGRRVQRPRFRVGLKPEPLWNSFDRAGKKVVRASARRRTTGRHGWAVALARHVAASISSARGSGAGGTPAFPGVAPRGYVSSAAKFPGFLR